MEKPALGWRSLPMIRFNLPRRDRAFFAQLFRYALIGLVSNLSGYLVYLLLTSLGSTPKITMSFLYGIGAVIGFFGNRNLTFYDKGNVLGSSVRYTITHIFGYILNFSIIFVFVDTLRYPHQFVQAIAIFVVAVFLFVVLKRFVFRDTNLSNMGGA